ncbi:phytanoyl-CoA dioxygenase family protein [Denitrobaculum tricleocarpae]|nr:phytanoyl-CoA dioxygenase family protein [Denitrobaculum tricleocarpae]
MKLETSILEDLGRVWVRGAIEGADLSALDRACEIGAVPGGRLEWNADLIAAAGVESRLTRVARDLVPGAFPVRILAFNKTSEMNWSVPWHQDRVIAVKERHELEGYNAWTRKAGIWHVEPPVALLEEMFFARIHLDDSDGSNGCLQVGLGTHRSGRIAAKDVLEVAEQAEVEDSVAKRGDVLFVKALTLHRSSPSQQSSSRRTLRIDYSVRSLPAPLEWALSERSNPDLDAEL